MKNLTQVGVWIDSKKATLVILNNGKETIKSIESNFESRIRVEGEGKQYTRMGNQFSNFEKVKEKKLTQQLKNYYEKVIVALKDADSIVILGPAEAKTGLHKAISKIKAMSDKVKFVDTADSMTENQVIALLKGQFI